jgi:hypothetical protein
MAQEAGRYRWKVENEGFNRPKQSGLNLGHVYSTDPEKGQVYGLLLQSALILVQGLGRGSRRRRLAEAVGRPVWKLFGSRKNVARRLRDSVRFVAWEADRFAAASRRIRPEDSSEPSDGSLLRVGTRLRQELGRPEQPAAPSGVGAAAHPATSAAERGR